MRPIDAAGNLVRDLGVDDFEILEDGVPQTIDAFAFVDLPLDFQEPIRIAGRDADVVPPDVSSNTMALDGRLYVLVLDDLHTSTQGTNLLRQAARRFVESRLGEHDRVAVVTTGGRSASNQPLTDNRQLVLRAIDQFLGGTPAVNASRQALRVLERTVTSVGAVRGRRKALLYLSEGIDVPGQQFQLDSRMAIAAATQNNVSIYVVDPRGPIIPGEDRIAEPPTVESAGQAARRLAGDADIATPSFNAELGLIPRALGDGSLNLRWLADESGGFAVIDMNVDVGFDRVVRESSAYYLLGYHPGNDRREGRTRRLEVRIRRPGVRALARDNYVEPGGAPPIESDTPAVAFGVSTELAAAVMAPLPLPELPLSITAAAFQGAAATASVAVVAEVDGQGLSLVEEAGAFHGTVELSVTAFDADGALSGGEGQGIRLSLSPTTLSRVREFGFRTVARIELPPGHYQVRVGGRDPASGTVGTVFTDIDVPDFSSQELAISHLVVTASSAEQMPTPREDARLAEVLPFPPTTQRGFGFDDSVSVFAEVYPGTGLEEALDLTLTATVLAEDGRVEFEQRWSPDSTDVQEGRVAYHLDLPVWTLASGRYILTVEARSGSQAVRRRVPFRVHD